MGLMPTGQTADGCGVGPGVRARGSGGQGRPDGVCLAAWRKLGLRERGHWALALDLDCTCVPAQRWGRAWGGPGGRGRGLDGHGVARWLVRGSWARASAGFGLRVRACAGASAGRCAGRGRVAMLALVWPCLPSGDCAVWSGRLGVGTGLGMHDRRGMDAGCESGAGCLRAAPGPSEFRASGYFVRSAVLLSHRAGKALHRAWRSLLVGASYSCSRPHLEGGGPRELPHVAFAHI